MEEKVERKTEYIIPYQDSGIGNKINLKVVGVIWAILFLLKIICKDEDWAFFLMFTALLLLSQIINLLNSSKKIKEIEKKDGTQYTLFKKDPSDEEDLNKKTTIIIDEDIFKGDGDDEERTIEARLEIQKEPSQNPEEDDKFKYDLSIDVDPDLKDHLSVDVHGQVDGRTMNVVTRAATEGEGMADVRAQIQYGDDKDEDEVELMVSDDSSSDSDEMKLVAGKNRKKSKRSKSSAKGKKGPNTEKKH